MTAERTYDRSMHKDSAPPIVIIAMNTFRAGGSQTYAFTLAKMLKDQGFRPVLVAKSGPWFKEATKSAQVIRVLWSEGTAHGTPNPAKRMVLRATETLSAIRLSSLVRQAALVITSQPGPTSFFSSKSSRHWPKIKQLALVHGTSAVEWPFPDHARTLGRLNGLLAATDETSAFLCKSAPGKTVRDIGNLFRGELFWGERLDQIIQEYRPSGPVVFLGTLTPNKTGPLSALFSAVASLDARLVVVGGGPHESALRKLAEDSGLAHRISFAGAVSDPRPWITQAAVVVTAGRGAIESMAAGRPTLIATSDGVHGLANLDNLAELERFNFTGRTPSSREPSTELMTRELTSGFQLNATERVEIAKRMGSVGSINPIIQAINES